MDLEPAPTPVDVKVRPAWYRVLLFPKTVFKFWKFLRAAGEPRALKLAFSYSKLTIARRKKT
jgi:hypothetical protein